MFPILGEASAYSPSNYTYINCFISLYLLTSCRSTDKKGVSPPYTRTVQSYSPIGANVHPHLIHASLNLPDSTTQTTYQSVQRFCRAHDRDKQTDRQTDRATPSATTGRTTYVVLRCGLKVFEIYTMRVQAVSLRTTAYT